jgi:SWI/SNF-related matrix-associated actin-dependent regulator 1 of chromatin subfamily A
VFAQIQAKRRIAMTGTPILNRPVELFTTLFWLDPARWNKRKSFFEKRYCGAFQGQWGWVNDGATHLDELQEVLRTSVLVRRLKKEVLTELPPKVRAVIELEGDANAKRAAKAEMDKWQEFESLRTAALEAKAVAKANDDQAAYEEAVAALEEANAVAFESMSQVRHDTAMAKLPTVIDFVTEILEDTDKKLVIFAHHHDVIDGLMAALCAHQPVKLDGTMSQRAKQASIDQFQNVKDCRVFIGSTLAAGVGITLTAASHVVFAELDWTPARVTQAEDRCHRIGQVDSVLVQHLVLEGSLDAYMAQMIVDKQRIADAALDKGGKPVEVKEQKTAIEVKVDADAPKPELSAEQVAAAHQAMKILAGVCDGARSWDDHGFNKLDTAFGKALAAQHSLSQRQAKWAAKLANKYRRQLPAELLAVIKGEA